MFQSESFHQGRRVVRKEWEGKVWSCVIVWDLYGFVVTGLLHLSVLGESLLSEHAVQEVPWSGQRGEASLRSDGPSMGNTVVPWTMLDVERARRASAPTPERRRGRESDNRFTWAGGRSYAFISIPFDFYFKRWRFVRLRKNRNLGAEACKQKQKEKPW